MQITLKVLILCIWTIKYFDLRKYIFENPDL